MYQVRLDLGKLLGKKIKELNLDIDLVAPVPDTSRSAAIALAEEMNLPYREVLMKNRYVQRSFILNTQAKRREAVNLKFAVVEELVRGKKILLVDDSIVRGTTSEKIIELLKHYGAEKIYFASTCPPIKHPCSYGIAFPKKEELVANGLNTNGIAKKLGADQIIYTDLDDLKTALNIDNFCTGCLTGEYPYDRRNSAL
jgi:amidophosphoribosyltransferase